MTSTAIFIGIRGDVIALDRATGQELWRTELKGTDFVNLLVDGDRIISATKGEVYCLDAATGHIIWRNDLPGEGRGLVTIAAASGSTSAMPAFREKQRRDEEAASTSAIVATT
jgi:outer membrane protein assembly factor BamB